MKYVMAILVGLCMTGAFSLFDVHAYSVQEEKSETLRNHSPSNAGEWRYDVPFFDQLFDPANSTPYRLQVASHGMEFEFAEEALLALLSRANNWPQASRSQGNTFNLSDYFSNGHLGGSPDVITIAFDQSMRNKQYAELYQKNTHVTSPTSNSPAPVPEPATLLLLGSALSGLALWTRKRK